MTPDEKELSRFYPGENIKHPQEALMVALRHDFSSLARGILEHVPASADRSSAIRYLRLAHMQVNAAICHDWTEEKNEA